MADDLRQVIRGRRGWKATGEGQARYATAGADWYGLVRRLGNLEVRYRWHAAVIDPGTGTARQALGAYTAAEAVDWLEQRR